MEISLEKDLIQQESIGEIVKTWKHVVERSAEGNSSIFYIAGGSNQKQEEVIKYLAQELAIGEGDRINLEDDSRNSDLTLQLSELGNRIKSLKGKSILITVGGFEKRFVTDDGKRETMSYRISHNYDQGTVELQKKFKEAGKQLIIVIKIGLSCGQNAYEDAVRSTTQSHFKRGMIELQN